MRTHCFILHTEGDENRASKTTSSEGGEENSTRESTSHDDPSSSNQGHPCAQQKNAETQQSASN